MKILGFEGTWDAAAVVACASVAIADGQHLFNTTTKRAVPLSEVAALTQSGNLTLLKRPLEVDDSARGRDLTIVIVRTSHPLSAHFLIDTGRTGGLVAHERVEDEQYYVFSGETALNVYRDEVCVRATEQVLSHSAFSADHIDLVRWCVALNSRNPFVQALRVFVTAENRDYIRRLAVKSVASDKLDLFHDFLEALLKEDLDYTLKYEQGAAQGGGFDVDIAADTLRAIQHVHGGVEPILLERFPFLGDSVPAPRFKMMVAQSAELHFRTHLEGHSLRERVARHLELRMLHKLLRGEALPQLTRTKRIEDAISEITQPTAETILHHSVDNQSPETVLPERQQRTVAEESKPITVFGFQSGLIRDAAKIEMRIFPDFSLLLSVGTDLSGQQTLGVEFLETEHDFLRKPMALTVKQLSYGSEREVFALVGIKPIEVGESHVIDAIPSSIVERAFVTGQTLTLTRQSEDTIASELGLLSGVAGRTKAQAAGWIRRFAELCYEFELARAIEHPLTMIVPLRNKSAPALARVAVSLAKAGGASLVSDLVNEINRRFSTIVRINNTRREVYRHPDLLEFDPSNDQVMRLTVKGKAYAAAYLSYGGNTGNA